MPVLKNTRHERMAQELAKGKSAGEAHDLAGYKHDDGNAIHKSQRADIQERVREIMAPALQKIGVTVESVVRELARIGFSDLRKAVDWSGTLVEEEDQPEGDVVVIRHIHANHVRLVSAKDLDDDTAAAIAEVRQNKEGVTIKLHDKQAALVSLGKHLGMFQENVNVRWPDGIPKRASLSFGGKLSPGNGRAAPEAVDSVSKSRH
jgi:phage terminase small subunit